MGNIWRMEECEKWKVEGGRIRGISMQTCVTMNVMD